MAFIKSCSIYPGFPRGGGVNPKGWGAVNLLFGRKFPQKPSENERIWTQRGAPGTLMVIIHLSLSDQHPSVRPILFIVMGETDGKNYDEHCVHVKRRFQGVI